MVTSVNTNPGTKPVTYVEPGKAGMSGLGQADFLKMLTTQLTNQDPTDPVDNKDMLAQMAQFSSVAGITQMSETMNAILAKLDAVFPAQSAGTGETDTSTANS